MIEGEPQPPDFAKATSGRRSLSPHPPFGHLLQEEKCKGNGISFEGGRANLFLSAFAIKHFVSWILLNKYSRVDVADIMIISLMQHRSISFGEGEGG